MWVMEAILLDCKQGQGLKFVHVRIPLESYRFSSHYYTPEEYLYVGSPKVQHEQALGFPFPLHKEILHLHNRF